MSAFDARPPELSELVLRRLESAFPLTPSACALVAEACRVKQPHLQGEELDFGRRRLLLLSGWACRARRLRDGRRQIVSFLLPGDAIDLSDRDEPRLHLTLALTRGQTADGDSLAEAPPEAASLAQALRAADRAEAVRLVDQAVRLSALNAYQAMAHLMLELHDRLATVGLVEDGRFSVPVAQEALGEALGVTEVHANRVLSQLRRDGLLVLGPGWVALTDRDALAAAAGGV